VRPSGGLGARDGPGIVSSPKLTPGTRPGIDVGNRPNIGGPGPEPTGGGFANTRCAPLLVDGVLYITEPNTVLAIDARNGREIWKYTWRGLPAFALGNRGAARDQYEALKRLLQRELGVEPGREIRKIYQDLIGQE